MSDMASALDLPENILEGIPLLDVEMFTELPDHITRDDAERLYGIFTDLPMYSLPVLERLAIIACTYLDAPMFIAEMVD